MVDGSFRWSVVLLLVSFGLICIQGMGGPPESRAQVSALSQEPPREAPSMSLSETSFDFGEVDEGAEVSHDFLVKNTGKAELQISKVSPG